MSLETESKKGFLSRLTNALFEEIETSTPDADAPPPPVAMNAGAAPVEPAPIDEKLRQELLGELANKGQLFNQFLDLAASLAELIPQESASFQAALRALEKTSGAGKRDVLAAVERQLAALAEERNAFAESVQKKLATQQAATRKSDEIRARISEMHKSIKSLEEEEQQLLAKIAHEEKLIRTAQLRFDSTAREIERELLGKLEKVRSYLPDAPEKDRGGKA